MTEHGNSFLKSIISSYEFHSFFRYLILKLEKSRQPVTKYNETTTFCRSFPLPTVPSINVDGSVNYAMIMLRTNYNSQH